MAILHSFISVIFGEITLNSIFKWCLGNYRFYLDCLCQICVYYRGIVPVTCDNLFSKIEKGGDSNQVSEQQSHVSFLAWKYMSKNNCMESVIITLGLYEKNKIKLSWWFLEDILQARVHLNTSLKRNTLLGLFYSLCSIINSYYLTPVI